jgi:hypothetical protein
MIDHFINSNEDNLIENINSMKKYINESNIQLLIEDVKKKINKYSHNEKIYLSLKSFNIFLNKQISKNDPIKNIKNILNAMKDTNNMKRIIFYIQRISNYIDEYENVCDLDYIKIIEILENILYNEDIKKENNILTILLLINKCKRIKKIKYNELEELLYKVDNNIYDYIYFLRNKKSLNEKNDILSFMNYLNFYKKDVEEIDKLNLKRGFIQTIKKNNKLYLLKYQPNKSVLELIFNTYLKLLNHPNFLLPSIFIINSDLSYFYVIEKYNCDLNKYFNLLHKNNRILSLEKLIEIALFLIRSISFLHKNNIVHCDLKLENIVINVDEKNDISDLKIIDFDVSLFEKVPKELENNVSERYKKILNNKKERGTRIYMLKNEKMNFQNDIFSLGVILLILLYKNIKLMLFFKKSVLKNLNVLRDSIEDNNKKIEMLDLLKNYIKNNKESLSDFIGLHYSKLKYYAELIIDCIHTKLDINNIEKKYNKLFLN